MSIIAMILRDCPDVSVMNFKAIGFRQ